MGCCPSGRVVPCPALSKYTADDASVVLLDDTGCVCHPPLPCEYQVVRKNENLYAGRLLKPKGWDDRSDVLRDDSQTVPPFSDTRRTMSELSSGTRMTVSVTPLPCEFTDVRKNDRRSAGQLLKQKGRDEEMIVLLDE